MEDNIGATNVIFGWVWLFVGVLFAIWMGLYAFEPDWLGGYTSLSRRLLRLSHIAFIALSLTNILYGLFIDTVQLNGSLKKIGAFSLIVASIFMPAVCLLSILDRFFQFFFFIPALSFACGIFVMAFGQIKRLKR